MTIEGKDLKETVDILFNPEKYGYKDCEDCDGYGSTTRDINVIHELCGTCGGDGVVKKSALTIKDKKFKKFLGECSEKVKTWPEWKKKISI